MWYRIILHSCNRKETSLAGIRTFLEGGITFSYQDKSENSKAFNRMNISGDMLKTTWCRKVKYKRIGKVYQANVNNKETRMTI